MILQNNIFFPINRIKEDISNGIPFFLECSDFYKMYASPPLNFTKFSDKASKVVYDGASVVYAAMQLAIYLGFNEIVLLGVDCNYDKNKITHGAGLDYTDYKYNWTKDTALTMIEGFKVAKDFADTHNIKIYNATRGGMLEVFERVKLEEML